MVYAPTCISFRVGAISSMSIDLNGTPLSRNPSLYLFPLYSLRCPQPQSPQRNGEASQHAIRVLLMVTYLSRPHTVLTLAGVAVS